VRWLDPGGIEVNAHPLSRFIHRPELRIAFEFGDILMIIGAENTACRNINDARAGDTAIAFHGQV
jgi:hypothetical protein